MLDAYAAWCAANPGEFMSLVAAAVVTALAAVAFTLCASNRGPRGRS